MFSVTVTVPPPSTSLPCIDSVGAIAGITALEMAEGKPPYGDIHPMRVCMVNTRLVLCGVILVLTLNECVRQIIKPGSYF